MDAEAGYPATGDEIMPFRGKPNISMTFVDKVQSPVPYTATHDGFGYRNGADGRREYERVLVGDSMVWGKGVNDDETVTAYMNELDKKTKTYNLGIANAGPEMYMAMIDEYLKRGGAKDVLVYYWATDHENLKEAWWEGLESCRPPDFKSKIVRFGVPPSPSSPPSILYAPVLRDSFLASKLYSALASLGGEERRGEEGPLSDMARPERTGGKGYL